MNDIVKQDPAPTPSTISLETADMLLTPGTIEAMERAANLMSAAKAMLPAHLRNSPGDCMAVLMQAAQWKMNPFALAQKTFMVPNAGIGYEAQAIKAAVDQSPRLAQSLGFEWFGPWDQIVGKIEWKKGPKGEYATPGWTKEDERGVGVVCTGLLRGEAEPRELRLDLRQCYPRNSTLWGTDPRQQIAYLATKRWARLYVPGVLLGVYDEEEAQEINVTPVTEERTTIEKLMVKQVEAEPQDEIPKEKSDTETRAHYEEQDNLLDALMSKFAKAKDSTELKKAVASGQVGLEGEWLDRARQAYHDRNKELHQEMDEAAAKEK